MVTLKPPPFKFWSSAQHTRNLIPVPRVNQATAMKKYGVQFHAFLMLSLKGHEELASGPGHFTPRESAPST